MPLGTASAVAASVAVLVGLYALALWRTAGLAAAGSALAVLAAAATGAVAGLRPWNVAGTALVAAGAAAVAWVLGRSRRRRRAERSALAAYRTGAAAIPRFAALAERDRLAVELHDVAAHRLTAIVVSAAAAKHVADPERTAAALRHAATAARQAITELDLLTDRGDSGGGEVDADRDSADSLAGIAALAAESGAHYRSTASAIPPPTAALAHRVVREALTNSARYARGSAIRVAVEAAPGLLTVTVSDSGGTTPEPHLGTGHGLPGLRTTVAAAGGILSHGPTGHTGPGWTVRAELPFPQDPPRAQPASGRGPRRRPPLARAHRTRLGAGRPRRRAVARGQSAVGRRARRVSRGAAECARGGAVRAARGAPGVAVAGAPRRAAGGPVGAGAVVGVRSGRVDAAAGQ